MVGPQFKLLPIATPGASSAVVLEQYGRYGGLVAAVQT